MKRTLTLILLVFILLLYYYRQRVFLRDPVATVYRDEVKQSGVEIFINNADDVLLEKDDYPGAYRILVQHWDRAPGTPARLTCLPWTACVTEADNAPILPITDAAAYDPKVIMTDREVTFMDPTGARIRIELR